MVSTITAAERFSVGLGYLMASRALLAGVSRVDLNHHYAVQSGFIQDELEKLVEPRSGAFYRDEPFPVSPIQWPDDVSRRSPRSAWTPYDFRTWCVWTAYCESCEADAASQDSVDSLFARARRLWYPRDGIPNGTP